MPTVPVKAAGWRIEPPVSVPVAPSAMRAATAAAEPPEEPPGTSARVVARFAPPRIADARRNSEVRLRRAHGELVHVDLAQHHRAGLPQVGGDGQFIGRLEAFEDVRAGGGLHALGAEQVLDRRAGCPRACRPAPLARRSSDALRHGERLVRRLDDKGVEVAMPFPSPSGARRASSIALNVFLREAVQRVGDGQAGQSVLIRPPSAR